MWHPDSKGNTGPRRWVALLAIAALSGCCATLGYVAGDKCRALLAFFGLSLLLTGCVVRQEMVEVIDGCAIRIDATYGSVAEFMKEYEVGPDCTLRLRNE